MAFMVFETRVSESLHIGDLDPLGILSGPKDVYAVSRWCSAAWLTRVEFRGETSEGCPELQEQHQGLLFRLFEGFGVQFGVDISLEFIWLQNIWSM